MNSIIPILLVVLAIAFLSINKRKKFVTVKITHWLLLIYAGVLFLSMAAAPFVADGKLHARETVSEKELSQADNQLHQALRRGKVEDIDEKYLVNQKNFDNYQGKTLEIDTIYGNVPELYVERKQVDDGKIEVFCYASALTIDTLDFTDMAGEPLSYVLENNILTIKPPKEREVKVSIVKNEFTINQFTEAREIGSHIIVNSPYLYMRIPKTLELIEGTEMSAIFVGE